MKAAVTVKENYEFRRIYRKGKTAVGPGLVIYCQKNRQGLSRLGITVSTKLGKAVVRNRVRRRIREIYRLNKPAMKPGWDVILVARMRAVTMEYRKLNQTYLRLLEQVGLLENPQ
ncbi:MAG: ribonuclease P protein component [Ruminococcaceae bacterium]|nr:ribonuclease P protein component [Oscillospiraceae bacterium]